MNQSSIIGFFPTARNLSYFVATSYSRVLLPLKFNPLSSYIVFRPRAPVNRIQAELLADEEADEDKMMVPDDGELEDDFDPPVEIQKSR